MFKVTLLNSPKIKMNRNKTCLHIGCGLNVLPEWRNIDASPSLRLAKIPILGHWILSVVGGPNWSSLVEYGDIVKGLEIEHKSCEIIFSAHVLEHLSRDDFHSAMKNIYSYLKPEGVFRAIVPDLEQYVADYINQRSDSSLSIKAADEFMSVSLIGHSDSRKSLPLRLREAFSNSRHQWMWDEPSLVDAFNQHGFKNVRRCNYGDWSDTRFGAVEKEENYVNAICIEGKK